MHLVSGCENLAQKDYKERHDELGLYIHWLLCCKYDTVKPAYKNLVIKNIQAENSQIRSLMYKNPFSLKLEIGSYLWRSSN